MDLVNFIERNHPDILLLSETKLDTKHEFSIQDYEIVRSYRKTGKGGVAIVIHNRFKFRIIDSVHLQNLLAFDFLAIEIKMNNRGDKLIIGSIYSPSSQFNNQFITEFQEIFDRLNLLHANNYYVFAGDCNARHPDWQNKTSDSRGRQLQRWLAQNASIFRINFRFSEKPTFIRTNSYIDLAFVDNRFTIESDLSSPEKLLNTLRHDSDHRAIQVVLRLDDKTFNELLAFQVPPPPPSNANMGLCEYTLAKTDWFQFKCSVDCDLRICKKKNNCGSINTQPSSTSSITLFSKNSNMTNADIDKNLDILNNLIIGAIKKSTPIKPDQKTLNNKNNIKNVYADKRTFALYNQKSKVISQIKKLKRNSPVISPTIIHPYYHQINTLKSIINNINNLIKQNLKININRVWNTRLSKINPRNSKNMFVGINRIFRQKTNSSVDNIKVDLNNPSDFQIYKDAIDPTVIPQNVSNSVMIITDMSDKLNFIGEFWQEKTRTEVQSHLDPICNAFTGSLAATKKYNLFNDTDQFYKLKFDNDTLADSLDPQRHSDNLYITVVELENIFHCANNKISSGLDGIPMKALKNLPRSVVHEYCILFNNIVNNNYYPSAWKHAKVLPILKKDKAADSHQNYRPITLVNNISKIFEVVIYNSLLRLSVEKQLIPPVQFGFRFEHSTTHAINKVSSDVIRNFNVGAVTGAILIDIERAFDSVWIEGLLFKLHQMCIPLHLIYFLLEMLKDRHFVVTNGLGVFSRSTFKLYNGLQQGTILAPILFSLYISSLLKSDRLNSIDCQVLAYADDMIIYSSGKRIDCIQSKLQNALNFINKDLKSWKISINSAKCEAILFRRPLSHHSRNIKSNWNKLKVNLDNIQIVQKVEVKYLGVLLDQYLYFIPHLIKQLSKARNAFALLNRLFFAKHLSKKVKLICYQLLIRPIITYACPVWYNVNATIMEKLRVFERKCIRACLAKYRDLSSPNLHYFSNKSIYDGVKFERIDLFVINLVRNHVLRSLYNTENSMIYAPYQEQFDRKTIESGFPPPNAFIQLDSMNYIQDARSAIPLIYHLSRRSSNKSFPSELYIHPQILRYKISISEHSLKKYRTNYKKYWWLGEPPDID